MSRKYRIGIDVGGTNTDAVVLACSPQDEDPGINDPIGPRPASDTVVAWHKSPTTPDVTSGIASALESVLAKSQIDRDDILYLSIGTTHFLNAVIEADPSRLSRIAVLRLAGPYTARCPPFIDFPARLRTVIEGHVAILDGGLEIDGKEITPINDAQIREQCNIIRAKGICNIAIVGVFSPLASTGAQEEYVKQVIETYLVGLDVNVVCSKDVGHIGLLERENATILNTSILSFARKTMRAYQQVLKRLSLKCPLFLTQLDGTLVPASVAASVPIRTFSNGPTNSMRGASFLAGLERKISSNSTKDRKSVIVVDVGGTTTDVGVLLPSGFPRKAAAFTEVGGVRTSFSMPDIHSIGLGGGSRVRFVDTGVTVGPDSVGHAIQESALVFGGDTLTATDLAIASGLASPFDLSISNSARENVSLEKDQADAGISTIQRMLETAIDRMKTEPGDSTLILVGGGSLIVPPTLSGIKEIIKPPYHDVANAVGAAIARVSGSVDRVEIPGGLNGTLEEIVVRCKEEACAKAVATGARGSSVEVLEVTVIQLPYVSNHASRIIVRAVGDLDFKLLSSQSFREEQQPLFNDEPVGKRFDYTPPTPQYDISSEIDPFTYCPEVTAEGIWMLSETDMEWIAGGCAVLGCGGGGATYAAFLMARQSVRDGRKIRVISASVLDDPDAWVLPCGFMGSPSVSSERIPSGEEIPIACTNLMKYLGVDKVAAIISDEIGGKNGLEPMLLASRNEFDRPVIDGDLMGRAYPRLNQILPCIFKQNGLFPVAAADGVGNCMIVPSARNNPIVEDILRAACTVLGSSVALSICPLRAGELVEHAITGTTSQAWRIGRAISLCRKSSDIKRVPESIISLQGGRCLFVGKIIEVIREVRGGFTHGKIVIAPLAQDEQESSDHAALSANLQMVIPFQNENLCAEIVKPSGEKEIICTVPDLIAVLDSQNGASIGTQDYRYGLRVTVVGLACDPRWTTAKGLEIGGPQAFGMDIEYKPIGAYIAPKSVIEEYR